MLKNCIQTQQIKTLLLFLLQLYFLSNGQLSFLAVLPNCLRSDNDPLPSPLLLYLSLVNSPCLWPPRVRPLPPAVLLTFRSKPESACFPLPVCRSVTWIHGLKLRLANPATDHWALIPVTTHSLPTLC